MNIGLIDIKATRHLRSFFDNAKIASKDPRYHSLKAMDASGGIESQRNLRLEVSSRLM